MELDESTIALGLAVFIVLLFIGLLITLVPGALWEKRELKNLIQSRLINSDCLLDKAIKNISVCNSISNEENIDEFVQQGKL